MRKWVEFSLGWALCLCLMPAAFAQSENISQSVSRDLGAFADGGLTDGGELQLQLTASLTPGTGTNASPPTLGVFLNDPSTGAFGFMQQNLGPGEFAFINPKTLAGAHLNTTISSADPNFNGLAFDVTWTANTPLTKSTMQQHMATSTELFHMSVAGSSRFATISGTANLSAPEAVVPLNSCCTWNGAQITNNLTQSITVIKP